MSAITKITDIRRLSKTELTEYLTDELELPRYRSDQIWQWIWQKGVQSFDEMTNLPLSLRSSLKSRLQIFPISIDKTQYSEDGTIKSRFRLYDGHMIEAVLIPVPVEKRYTVCVSSQVGCSLSCSFCATGKMKRERNLEAAEIYDQVFLLNQQCQEKYGEKITNIVFMGMGEPLLNYHNVMISIDRITSEDGLHMSARRITVSTAGIGKMIRKLADDRVRFNLALSLHAADDTKRNEIMPINEQNNLKVLADALAYFYHETHNKITLEYIAFQHFNDEPSDAKKLAHFCKSFPAMINIIEYNPIEGFTMSKSDPDRLERFARELTRLGAAVTVRRSRGKDIEAACGQLANKG